MSSSPDLSAPAITLAPIGVVLGGQINPTDDGWAAERVADY